MSKSNLELYLDLLELGVAHPEDDTLFKNILKQSESVLLLTDLDLAEEMEMSRPTINRWRSGVSAPLVVMRRSVFAWLKKRTKLMIKRSQPIETIVVATPLKAIAKEVESSGH